MIANSMNRTFGRKPGFALAFLLAATFSVSGMTACTRHHSFEGRADWITSKISGKLDLTSDQESKLNNVKQAVVDARKAHQADRDRQIDEAKKLILSDRLDSAKVKSLILQRHKLMEQDFDKVFGKVAEFHASLTPEQKKKAVELIDKYSGHED